MLTINTRETAAEFFDTIIEWSLKESIEALEHDIKHPPPIGIWSTDPKEDIKIAKKYLKALRRVSDYYGIKL
jgi:hypothetical protein